MVRITDERTLTADGKRQIQAFGLSTDDKPTVGILTGSVFIAIDTTEVFFFDEDSGEWIKSGNTQ